MIVVLRNLKISSTEQEESFKIDDFDVLFKCCVVEKKFLKIFIEASKTISITLTLYDGRFIYEKKIFPLKFMDQIYCKDDVMYNCILKVCYKPVNHLWNDYLDIGGFGNFIIVAENKEIKISKELLQLHSPVFSAMMKMDSIEAKDNKWEIKDFSFDVVKILTKTLYSENPPENASVDDMGEVCRFADKYDMKNLWVNFFSVFSINDDKIFRKF